MTSDVQWQNYLDEATDAVLTGTVHIDSLRAKYGITYKDDQQLLKLIEDLDKSLVTIEPSVQFATRLKDDLMGVERTGVVWQIRKLPARVQWAGIVAALLGGVWVVFQRLSGAGDSLHEDRTRIPEES